MAKIQVPIEDKLMMEAKLYAITHQTSLKDLVSAALKAYITNTSTTTIKTTKSNTSNKTTKTTKANTSNTVVHDNTTNTSTKKKEVILEPTPVKPLEEDDDYDQSMGGLFHLYPKTHKVGKPERQMKQYHEGPISWMVLEGCRAHYDKHGKPIPFRITGEDGSVWEPDQEELQEISRTYGKQVMIEE